MGTDSELAASPSEYVDGDVRFGDCLQNLYATDASIYEMIPVGVALSRSTDGVAAVVSYCASKDISVLPRGGGSNLTRHMVNEAVVLDCAWYMGDDDAATTVAANTYWFCEYLDRHDLDRRADWARPREMLTYHGHCHQKTVNKDHHAVGVLRRARYGVDLLDLGCCGMASSFGYQAEQYPMSQAMGRYCSTRSTIATATPSSRREHPVEPRSTTGPTARAPSGREIR